MTRCPTSFVECTADGTRHLVTFDSVTGAIASAIPQEGPNEGVDQSDSLTRADLGPCGSVMQPESAMPSVSYEDGPGTPGSAATHLTQSRCWIVTGGPTGDEGYWCILLDTNGVSQWHQTA